MTASRPQTLGKAVFGISCAWAIVRGKNHHGSTGRPVVATTIAMPTLSMKSSIPTNVNTLMMIIMIGGLLGLPVPLPQIAGEALCT